MIRFVEVALVILVGVILLKSLWPVLTGKSVGSDENIKLQKQIADAKEKLKAEKLRTELARLNQQIDIKHKGDENAQA